MKFLASFKKILLVPKSNDVHTKNDKNTTININNREKSNIK